MEKGKSTRKPKIMSKNRSKEEKETKKAFEAIAKKLLKDQLATFQLQMRSLIAANMDNVRHDMISIESSLSSRIITLESKVSVLTEKVEDLSAGMKKNIENVQEQQASNSDLLKASLELERSKRSANIKKLQEKISLIHSDNQEAISAIKKEQEAVSTNLFENVRAQSKDFTLLQEKVDDLLIAKFGYIPKSKSDRHGASSVVGSGSVLDHISQRMERMERALSTVDDELGTNLEGSFSNALGSPTRHNLSYKGTVNRIRKLEESVQSLQSQVQNTETAISQWRNQEFKNQQRSADSSNSETMTRVLLDVKESEKKVKRLAENTSKACRSLSQGLSDVQQATLNLYTWSDQVYDTLNVVTTKIGLPDGLCERAKVQRRRSKASQSTDLWL